MMTIADVIPEDVIETAVRRTQEALAPGSNPVARLAAYYSTSPSSKYAGSMFTRFETDPGQIEAGDLWAPTLLNVSVPSPFGERLLLDEAVRRKTAELLAQLDPSLRLEAVEDHQAPETIGRILNFHQHLKDQRSPRSQAWVMPAKLAARKRPHLIPVRDNVVFLYLEDRSRASEKTVLRNAERDNWLMRHLMRHETVSRRLSEILEEARTLADVRLEDSRLRALGCPAVDLRGWAVVAGEQLSLALSTLSHARQST